LNIKELYQSVTEAIIKELESGAVPWTKPWRNNPAAIGVMPQNPATGHGYRGINVPLLWHAQHKNNWPTPGFMTYRQAILLGGQVRKGEKGTIIVFTKLLRVKDTEDEEKKLGMLRTYVVFNNAQIEGLPPHKAPEPHQVSPFIEATKADIRYGSQPMYVPSKDFIAMPAKDDFKGREPLQRHSPTRARPLDRSEASPRPRHGGTLWYPPVCSRRACSRIRSSIPLCSSGHPGRAPARWLHRDLARPVAP
jgi:antirestriction protein ArdC